MPNAMLTRKLILIVRGFIISYGIYGEMVYVNEFGHLKKTQRNPLKQTKLYDKFYYKTVNRVAHSLAQASWSFASHRVFEYSPPCIIDLILMK